MRVCMCASLVRMRGPSFVDLFYQCYLFCFRMLGVEAVERDIPTVAAF